MFAICLFGCQQTVRRRIFVTSTPEGAQIFVFRDEKWEKVGITPCFFYVEKSQNIHLKAKKNQQIQKKIANNDNIVFHFPKYQKKNISLRRLAIVPIKLENISQKSLSTSLTDYITGKIRVNEQYKLVERAQIGDVIKDSMVTGSTKDLMGKVDLLLIGRVSQAGNIYTISFRLVSSENAEVINQASTKASQWDKIFPKALIVLKKLGLF